MPKIYVPDSFQADNDQVDWEKVRNFALAISSIVSACAIPLVGHWIASSLKQREIEVKYVEIAVDILSQNPDDSSAELREWATKTLNSYSSVKLTDSAILELREQPLPTSTPLISGLAISTDEAARMLRILGYSIAEGDGISSMLQFQKALTQFQRDHGLRADGIIGNRTSLAIRQAYKKAMEESDEDDASQPATAPESNPESDEKAQQE